MPTRILYVMFYHSCDRLDCKRRKKTKKPIPDGWIKTREHRVFCSQACLQEYDNERLRQSLISEAITVSGEGVVTTDRPKGRSHHYQERKRDKAT